MSKRTKHMFLKSLTIRSFGRETYNGFFTLDDVLEEQINLKDEIGKFKEFAKPKYSKEREKSTNF